MEVPKSTVLYLANTFYNIVTDEDKIVQLSGYDDRNFLIEDSSDPENKYVMKILHEESSIDALSEIVDEIIDGSHEYFKDTEDGLLQTPKLVRTSANRLSVKAVVRVRYANELDASNKSCTIKLFQYYEGKTMRCILDASKSNAQVDVHQLYHDLGSICYRIFIFLRTKRHLLNQLKVVRSEQRFAWQLATCWPQLTELAQKHYPLESGDRKRALMGQVFREFEQHKAKLDELDVFILHGDLNTDNVLVRASTSPASKKYCLIDFQDVQLGPRVADLAMLILYVLLEDSIDYENPERSLVEVPKTIYRGYCSQVRSCTSGNLALEQRELQLVPTLVKLRLCQSLLLACEARAQDATNEAYVMATHRRGWQLLELLVEQPKLGDSRTLAKLWFGAQIGVIKT